MVSIYAKSDGKDWICVRDIRDSNPRVWFNLSNGTIGTEITATGTIESVGNGWYRCSVYNNGSNGTTGRAVFLSVDADNSLTGTSSGTDGILIWGASVEQRATAGPYVRTGATAQTSPVLLPQGLTANKDITGVNAFESARNAFALNLDGASWAEVHDNASVDITDAITLEAWVYWDGAVNKGILGRWHSNSFNRNYLLYKGSDTILTFYINSSAPVSYTSLNATKGWTHIVGTYNRTNAVLYIDGVQQATAPHTPAISTGTLPVEIGRNFTSSNPSVNGSNRQPPHI
jgi:hypothetical protein